MNRRVTTSLRKALGYLVLLLLILGNSSANCAPLAEQTSSEAPAGVMERLVVARGSVVIDLDLNRLPQISSEKPKAKPTSFHFDVDANSFFTLLVFNNALRGPEPGSMALIPAGGASLPGPLASLGPLVIEKTHAGDQFGLVVREGQTGSIVFNIEGERYEYDAASHSLGIKEGRLLVSEALANKLGRPEDRGANVGRISISAATYPIEVTTIVNGAAQSSTLPPRSAEAPTVPNLVPGPDIIVGDLPSMEQFGAAGSQVGLAVGTTSC
ncbi:MAG: hypothetical protein WAO00_04945, partial [Chthoniobacterales bacterium]